jgi:pimeloyl-ACP methyl ester carboxylesterase
VFKRAVKMPVSQDVRYEHDSHSPFTVAGAEAYGKDVPSAEIHILDAGHFALDQRADEIARLTKDFLDRQKR